MGTTGSPFSGDTGGFGLVGAIAFIFLGCPTVGFLVGFLVGGRFRLTMLGAAAGGFGGIVGPLVLARSESPTVARLLDMFVRGSGWTRDLSFMLTFAVVASIGATISALALVVPVCLVLRAKNGRHQEFS